MTRINTNVSSLVAQKQLARSNTQLQQSLVRLSTGLRINVGKDDPAGLIASEILRSDIIATQRAITNSERANQIIATADSALGQVSALLNDIRGLVSEAANTGALSEEQITANQLQVDSSLEAIDRIAQTTSFQGRRLLDGSLDFLTTNAGNAILRASGTVGSIVDAPASGSVVGGTDANATVLISGQNGAPGVIRFEANSAGPSLNGLEVEYLAASGAATAVNFDTGTNTLTITVSATVNATAIAAAVNATSGLGLFASVSTGGAVFTATATDGQIVSGTLAGGNAANQLNFSAVTPGSRFNATVVVNSADTATSASYNTGSGQLTITRSANASAADVASAVNAGGVFAVSIGGNGAGLVSAGTYTAITGGTNNNKLILSAITGGTQYNGVQVVVANSNAAARATYSTSSRILTISQSANATVAETVAAVNANGAFSASTNGAGRGVITAGTYSGVTSGGATGSAVLNDLQIDQANFGTAASITVQVEVDQQATQAALEYSGGTIVGDLVLQIGGSRGFETFNFGSGTTISQIRDAVNLVSDATGVSASVASSANVGSVLRLESIEYGSDSFVSAKALNTENGGIFTARDSSGTISDRTTGTDVGARINGVQATGKGLRASLNSSTLDLNFEVNSQLQNGDTFSFSITGGGANFQIGPDVVSNQQARLGIQGLSTATLGGVSGKLYELRQGGTKDLSTDTKGAARVIDEVITSVTGLRGRLGAFQKTTLETNIFTLNDTLESLTEAESSIRDADFAVESARLTRAQILVQSGTSVLSIANQNPQNVLSLLR